MVLMTIYVLPYYVPTGLYDYLSETRFAFLLTKMYAKIITRVPRIAAPVKRIAAAIPKSLENEKTNVLMPTSEVMRVR